MDLLVEINQGGAAIVLVAHDAKVVARADRVAFTKDGHLVADPLLGKSAVADAAAKEEAVFARMAAVGI
jgi:putative ABC transport system ATP-binding protein